METNRRTFLTGAGAVLASAAWVKRSDGATDSSASSPEPRSFSITVLNPDSMVGGAGLCVVIRTPAGRTYLFDTANGDPHFGRTKNNGRDIVAPWLRAHGISKIDAVVISHYHADHFGGFLWLKDNFPIGRVFNNGVVPTDGKPLREHDAIELKCANDALDGWEKAHPGGLVRQTDDATDLGWDEPGVEFKVVWPPHAGPISAIGDFDKSSETDFPYHHLLNANSTAIRVKVGERLFYIGGDNASKQYMERDIRPYHEKNGTWGADVIVLPGHGDPTVWDHIAAMQPKPQVAIGSLGNLPWMMACGRTVLTNYVDKAKIRKTYCTNVHGDVTVETDGKDLRVTCDPEKLYVHEPK